MSNAKKQFLRNIDEWITAELQDGIYSFPRLLQQLPGVFPSDVLDSLSRLHTKGLLTMLALKAFRHQARTPAKANSVCLHNLRLPIPHPLDYDWRFTDRTVAFLLERAQGLTTRRDSILLLGGPSVFRAAIEQQMPRQIILADANPELESLLHGRRRNYELIQCNILTQTIGRQAKVVIADPPWYETETKHFIYAAARVCPQGGALLLSVPPAGTRPALQKELQRIMAYAASNGFALEEWETHALSYATPPFEVNALRSQDIQGIPHDWRRSHLAIFKRVSRQLGIRPALRLQTQWHEITVSGIRIRTRGKGRASFANPSLITIIEDDILPSVSRRDSRRRYASVWTSGNRIFACKGPGTLHVILTALRIGINPVAACEYWLGRTLSKQERAMVLYATSQLLSLIQLEIGENARFGEYAWPNGIRNSQTFSAQDFMAILTGKLA